jgi:hypothetical protein
MQHAIASGHESKSTNIQDCMLPRLESRFTPMNASMCSSATFVLSSAHLFACWASEALALAFLSIPLPLASCLSPLASCLLLIADRLSLIAYRLLLIAYCLSLIAYCLSLIASSSFLCDLIS